MKKDFKIINGGYTFRLIPDLFKFLIFWIINYSIIILFVITCFKRDE